MDDLSARVEKSTIRFREKLWHEQIGAFVPYDIRMDQHIEILEVGGLASLYSGVATDAQAQRMAGHLFAWHQSGYHLCPTIDPHHSTYEPARYWRGPIWPHVNALLAEGLEYYGYGGMADIVRDDTLDLVQELGFYEYFDARKEATRDQDRGYGGDRFSWTASTVIRMLAR